MRGATCLKSDRLRQARSNIPISPPLAAGEAAGLRTGSEIGVGPEFCRTIIRGLLS